MAPRKKPIITITPHEGGFCVAVGEESRTFSSRALAEAWGQVETAPSYKHCRVQFNRSEAQPYVIAYPSATAGGKAVTVRKKFSNYQKALNFAEEREIAAENHGRQFAADLTRDEVAAVSGWRVEASKLSGAGVDVPPLADVIRLALAQLAESPDGRKVSADLIDAFVSYKKDKSVGKHQVRNYENRLGRFRESFLGRAVASITTEEIERWLLSLKKRRGNRARSTESDERIAPQTRHHYRAAVFSFFQWATPKRNPVQEIDPPKLDEPDRDHYSPEEVKRLLDWILENDMALLPGCVIGLFCGVRTAERGRMDISDLDLTEPEEEGEFILKRGKVRSKARAVPLPPAAKAWLLAQTRRSGPVIDMSEREFHRRLAIACEKSGVRKIPNGFRHSFATYRGAIIKSSHQLKDEMGNSASIIDRRYRDARLQAEAKAFFGIRPQSVDAKIEHFKSKTA